MAGVADLLAKGADGAGRAMHDEPDGDESGDPRAAAESSVRSFFEAGQAGDYKAATSALSDAMALCSQYDGGEEDGEDGKGALVIGISPKKR